jgi:hypothetical protein
VLIFAAVIIAEAGFENAPLMLGVVALVVTPILFVFLRFGLISLITVLMVNQVLANAALTADLTQSHAAVGAWTLVALLGLAAWAFHTSKRGARPVQGPGRSLTQRPGLPHVRPFPRPDWNTPPLLGYRVARPPARPSATWPAGARAAGRAFP